MTDPALLNGRRIYAILSLEGEPMEQRVVIGVGSWDGTELSLIPDGRQSPLPIPLRRGQAPVHELTVEVRERIRRIDADNSATVLNALPVADYLGFWQVLSLPDWAAPVPEPLAVAWVPAWPSH